MGCNCRSKCKCLGLCKENLFSSCTSSLRAPNRLSPQLHIPLVFKHQTKGNRIYLLCTESNWPVSGHPQSYLLFLMLVNPEKHLPSILSMLESIFKHIKHVGVRSRTCLARVGKIHPLTTLLINEDSKVVKEELGIHYSECVEMNVFIQSLFPPGTKRPVALAIYCVMYTDGKCSDCMVSIQSMMQQLLRM
uniref:Uncharacterized protein n=1 Tax=Sphaerodactylus townsendi TaxID=933632 RepID=A0ACB8G2V2_9SAUR